MGKRTNLRPEQQEHDKMQQNTVHRPLLHPHKSSPLNLEFGGQTDG